MPKVREAEPGCEFRYVGLTPTLVISMTTVIGHIWTQLLQSLHKREDTWLMYHPDIYNQALQIAGTQRVLAECNKR